MKKVKSIGQTGGLNGSSAASAAADGVTAGPSLSAPSAPASGNKNQGKSAAASNAIETSVNVLCDGKTDAVGGAHVTSVPQQAGPDAGAYADGTDAGSCQVNIELRKDRSDARATEPKSLAVTTTSAVANEGKATKSPIT